MTFKAIATNTYLRTMIKPRMDMAELDVAAVRELGERMLRGNEDLLVVPPDITHTPVAAQPRRKLCAAEWLTAGAASAQSRTVLYTHGGAYCFGSLASHRPLAGYLARQLARHEPDGSGRVLSLGYRLAPEHPFPAPVDDALAWYRALLKQGTPPEQIVLAGDSAGGGLALACALAARAHKLPLPGAIVMFSPWLDLSCSGPSIKTKAYTESMLPARLPVQAAAIYLNGHDAHDPLASPLFADEASLAGLPPLLTYASHAEILMSDATRLHERAQAAGARSELHLAHTLPHAWPVMLGLPEARDTLRHVAQFIAALHVMRAEERETQDA
jgi:acetyl esterase/lipase